MYIRPALVMFFLSILSLTTALYADEAEMVKGYVTSSNGEVFKNSFGECWRSSYDETSEKLEECGYEKAVEEEPVVVELEVIASENAITSTTTVVEDIEFEAALLFAFDSAQLSDDGKALIDERIAKYKGKGELTSQVTVIGHTDSTGPEAYNQKLSERRARAVADYLLQHSNIVDDDIDIIGKGESEPVATNSTSEGRRLNRRVTVQLQGKLARE
jgi:OOP family OmpA-OmpF porin